MASTFQDFLDQYKGTVTAENRAKIAAAQKAAAAAAKLVKFNSSDPVKKEKEQAAFLAAAEAASNLLGTSKRWSTGAASNAEAKKAFDAYTKSIAALRKLNPTRATAVEKSIAFVTPDTPGQLGGKYYTGKGTEANPFLQSGKPFTGEYNNRKYKNGIEVLTTTTPSGQTLGASTPTPTPTPTPNVAGAGAGAGTGAGAGAGAGAGTGVKEKTAAELETEALNVAAEKDFALPETLFKNIKSLNALLKRYVDEKWTPDKLRKEIRNDLWFKQNSAEIKARYVQYYNFRDLQASGQAKGSTDYELQIAKIEENLKKRAVKLGSAAASDPAALRQAAENLYITNRSEDESFITDLLAASIRTTAGKIGDKVTEGYSGEALSNYKLLVAAARDNGFQVSDIIPGGADEQQVLQGIAAGTIDVNRIIADSKKLAAQGQPQYVRDLLAQNYTLKQIYAPYRQTMANILDIGDPDQIDLNDPTLRAAITDKGDMNVYDFKKLLRRDDRWQYTEQAKQDVSTAALDVLRDFGFQG
jgi:hypothetical protein